MTLLKFVDKVDAAPTTRLDLNTYTATSGIKLLRGFNPGNPAKRIQVSESGLVDGGTVTSAVDGLRTLTVPLQLYGDTNTRAETIHDLAVELDRDSNLLMYQPDGATHPVFFKTIPSELPLDLQHEGADLTDTTLQVQAQPYALGLREDLISALTVTNDPAAASRGLFVDLGTPKGDAPAHPFIWTAAAGGSLNYALTIEPNPGAGVYFFQAEAGVNGTDTADQADAGYSGGNGVRISYATNTLDTTPRITHTFPTDMPKGTYRLYARVDATNGTSVVTFTPRYLSHPGATSGLVNEGFEGDKTTWATESGVGRYLDLGTIQYPPGDFPATLGEAGTVAGDTPVLTIRSGRTSGTASVDVDHLLAVPTHGVAVVEAFSTVGVNSRIVIDGPGDRVYRITGTPFAAGVEMITGSSPAKLTGSIPMLRPGVPNRLHFWGYKNGSTGAHLAITDAVPLSVSYWPQYQFVRPVSS